MARACWAAWRALVPPHHKEPTTQEEVMRQPIFDNPRITNAPGGSFPATSTARNFGRRWVEKGIVRLEDLWDEVEEDWIPTNKLKQTLGNLHLIRERRPLLLEAIPQDRREILQTPRPVEGEWYRNKDNPEDNSALRIIEQQEDGTWLAEEWQASTPPATTKVQLQGETSIQDAGNLQLIRVLTSSSVPNQAQRPADSRRVFLGPKAIPEASRWGEGGKEGGREGENSKSDRPSKQKGLLLLAWCRTLGNEQKQLTASEGIRGYGRQIAMTMNEPVNKPVYFPRRYVEENDRRSKRIVKSSKIKLKEIVSGLDPTKFLSAGDWVKKVLTMTEDEVISLAGMDSAIFLRIFTFGLKLFIPICVFGIFVLIPVNVTDKSHRTVDLKSLDTLSMANVSKRSDRLVAHMFFAWIFSFWTYYRLYKEYDEITELRFKAIASSKRAPDQFTVLVRQVPENPSESISVHVEHFFRVNHPNAYLSHNVVYATRNLDSMVAKRQKLTDALSFAELRYEKKPTRRPTHKVGFLCWAKRVDTIDWCREELKKLNSEIAEELKHITTNESFIMPAAFVSFRSRYGAAIAAQTQQSKNPLVWLTEWAPEPRDVCWPNLSIDYMQLNGRIWVMRALLFGLVFFYLIPIGFVQSLANLESLNEKVPFFRHITNVPVVNQVLTDFLPGLALKIFLAILPSLLMVMSTFQGYVSNSGIQRSAAEMYYYFMIVNVFFGSIFAGSALNLVNRFKALLENPGDIPMTFGREIPSRAPFFITYIMLEGWAGFPSEALRVSTLVVFHIKSLLLFKTEKDKLDATKLDPVEYHVEIPRLMLFFLLGLVYSVTSPLLIPFLLTYFALGYVVFKNQIINVYDPAYESQGSFWPYVHGRVVTALVVMQIMLIGVFMLKEKFKLVPLLLPLPILTVFFTSYCTKRFFPAFQKYSMQEAMSKDTVDSVRNRGQDVRSFLTDAYLHPMLQAAKEDFDDIDVEDEESSRLPRQPGSPELIACKYYPKGTFTPRTGSKAGDADTRSDHGKYSGILRSGKFDANGGGGGPAAAPGLVTPKKSGIGAVGSDGTKTPKAGGLTGAAGGATISPQSAAGSPVIGNRGAVGPGPEGPYLNGNYRT
ncbi:hypothetical protein CBR_g34820 [Chara braunii]|uniref:Uncharacterized protein n=1 Tax=Chara braunii TaxID=69332 RepID=A0A388LJM0_CHABU|nr:hypothetical protein CBR_g34820 [Chara braunii]|eukprot:GBG82443.1 hypothetical protein CBR_g34820 [Chara braunii]